ncbi:MULTISPECIES: RagB/SusD family nutrient uptake outer membrane protein [unclassified Carboxylicivirga]|uniref:RagB/SusD family nutrient uptake outer membrane protein n=1 Tax=Carboxylicivirga TaxID=1628153 RepID=UPI003D350A70
MMNKIKIVLTMFSIALLSSSCLEIDLLETEPNDRLNNENYWQTIQDAEYAVNYLYTFLNGDEIGYDLYSDILVDNYGYDSDHGRMQRGIHQSDLGVFNAQWVNRFKGVRAANNFFENVDRVIEKTTDEAELKMLDRMVGEAHFFRAYCYTYLAFFFGDVPYIDYSMGTDEAMNVERTPVDQVWEHVFSDYDAAIDKLENEYGDADYGRLTVGAAYAMKARAALMATKFDAKYYSVVAEAAQKVIDLDIYSLYSNYEDLFKYAGEGSNETVLVRPYIGGGTYNRNSFSNRAPKSLKNGNPYYSATKRIADMYPMLNGLPITNNASGFDPFNPYVDRDPRMIASLFVNGDPLYNLHGDPDYPEAQPFLNMTPGNGGLDDVLTPDLSTPTGFYIKKYLDIQDYASPGDGGIDVMLIRYADVLLMAAEGIIETGGDQQVAADYIDLVRMRAGLPRLQDSGVNTGDRDAMRKAVRTERTIELAFEGTRYFDILRWRVAEDLMKGYVKGMRYVENGEVKVVKLDTERAFNPERDYLWPVPSKQLKLSPKLGQNDNY